MRLTGYPSPYSQDSERLFPPKYREEQFLDVSEKVLPKPSPVLPGILESAYGRMGATYEM